MRLEHRALAAASIALSLIGVVAVVALHVLRPDLAPMSHRLSEYAIGRYGGLMTAAFVCVGVSLLTLAGAIVDEDRRVVLSRRRRRRRHRRRGHGRVRGVPHGRFPLRSDRRRRPQCGVGAGDAGVDRRGGLLDGGCSRRAAPVVLATMGVALGAVSPALHRSRWTGLSQRLLWLTLLAWVIVAAFGLTHRHGASNRPTRAGSA